jgi:PDZ domain
VIRALLVLCCFAASLDAQSIARRAGDAVRISFPTGATTVPLRPGLRPVIDIMIDGVGPFRMLVETGAVSTAMTPAGFARLVPPSDTLSIRRRARATDSARVGSAVFTRLTVRQVATLGVPGIDGILALDAFRNALLTIDFPNATLTLSPDTLADANGSDILTLGTASNFWTVPVTLPSGDVHVILDTQSVLSLSAMPDAVKSFAFTSLPAIVGRARGPTVGDVPLQRARLAGEAKIGAYTMREPLVDLFQFPPQLPKDSYILGLEILRNFAISLDQRSGRIRFMRADRIVPPPPPAMSTGFATVPLPDGTRRVAFVATGQAADAAGVKVGDIVLRMNDTPIAAVEDDAWRRAMTGKDPVRFQLRRLSRELGVTILPTPLGF